MPATDTKFRDYTAAETTAYEAYIAAVAEHGTVCARPGATTRERMDAALAMDRAFKRFCDVAGLSVGYSPRSPSDISKIESLKSELGELTEAVRSAWAMLVAVDGMDAIHRLPSDNRLVDACNASLTLLSDATVVLRAVLHKADGV